MIKGFKILEPSDINPELEKIHRNGWDQGAYVGFPMIEKHYNMLPGSITDWTGYPQSGKTEMALEMLLFTSEAYGYVHLLWCPDIGRSVDIMIKLIHKHTGKTFKKQYPNFIAIEQVWRACPHLLHHFRIMHPTGRGAVLEPIKLWEYAAEYKLELAKSGQRLDTVLIDSWKDMGHRYSEHGGGYAQYLSYVLPQRNAIAEQSGLHFHSIIHPKNPVRDKKRKVYAPWPDDMEGGAQWNSSGKCIIAVHRDNWDNTFTDIYFRKVKPEQVGRATNIPIGLQFDIAKSRYYWVNSKDYSRVYAEKKGSDQYNEWNNVHGRSKDLISLPDQINSAQEATLPFETNESDPPF